MVNQECAQAEQVTFSKEMHLGLPVLQERVDGMVKRLTGAEQLWASKVDEMQFVVGQLAAKVAANAPQGLKQNDEAARELERRFKDVAVSITGAEEHCARRIEMEQQEVLTTLAVACRNASQHNEAELAAIRHSVNRQEESLAACSARECEQMSAIYRELESLVPKQQALSELASNACIAPDAQVARIRSIVAEFTNPISADVKSRFEALQSRPEKACANQSDHSSPLITQRSEPEPELIDLRRLEARQEESRQALEELQQQLRGITYQNGQEEPSMRQRLLQDLGQAQLLEFDECLKLDLKARLPSGTSLEDPPGLTELRARLELVSAEAAQCTDCQNLYGSELADMCRVLRDMDRKIWELSQLPLQAPITAGSAMDAVRQRPVMLEGSAPRHEQMS